MSPQLKRAIDSATRTRDGVVIGGEIWKRHSAGLWSRRGRVASDFQAKILDGIYDREVPA